jgi:multiple sugar transport system ATP-binding protein
VAFLLDEPLSNLDAQLRADMRLELVKLHRRLGRTIIHVTHDQVEAMTMASRIGVLKEGRMVQLGTPREIYEDPAETYVATRLGQPRINLVPRGLFPDVPAPVQVETIGVRTEHLKIDRHQQGKAKVARIEHLGDHRYLHLSLEGQPIVTLADHDTDLDVGDSVALQLERPLFFDREGQRVRG